MLHTHVDSTIIHAHLPPIIKGILLEDGFFTGAQAKTLRQLVMTLCHEVRAQAVPLVDAFGIADVLLKSPLGL